MINKIYCRRLYKQELGYRKGKPRQAGRYIYIAKNLVRNQYFPGLNDRILNDYANLKLYFPQAEQSFWALYIWNNDKIVENKPNGRNEFRLYLNDEIFNLIDLSPGSYVLLFKDEKYENLYIIYAIPDSHEYYKLIDDLHNTEDHNLTKNHSLIPIQDIPAEIISEPERETILYPEIPTDVKSHLLGEPLTIDPEGREQTQSSTYKTHSKFRDILLQKYNYECSMSGQKYLMQYSDLVNLDSAHIIPKNEGGGDNPINGIPLIKDLHWAFDHGMFTIDKEYKVLIHDKVSHSDFASLNGQDLILPEDPEFYPSQEALDYHRENVFGKFL